MLPRPEHLARAWHEGEIEAGRLGRLKLERRAAGVLLAAGLHRAERIGEPWIKSAPARILSNSR
jgi:hypothetical protein